MKTSQTGFNLPSRHEYMVEMDIFNVQRAITPKVSKPELRFTCSARRLMELYICVKFREIITRTIAELWSGHECMVEMSMFNIQRVIPPKVGKKKQSYSSYVLHIVSWCFTLM